MFSTLAQNKIDKPLKTLEDKLSKMAKREKYLR
jgi:hypothetical protein